jgi:hypothetical protein
MNCSDCGKRVFTSLEGFWEHKESNQVWVWHLDCRPPWQTSDDWTSIP